MMGEEINDKEAEMWKKARKLAIAMTSHIEYHRSIRANIPRMVLNKTWVFRCTLCKVYYYDNDYETVIRRGTEHIMAHLLESRGNKNGRLHG